MLQYKKYRASQKLSFHIERLASEPLGRGGCWRWAVPTASTLLSPLSAEGASCQDAHRLLQSLDKKYTTKKGSLVDE